LAQESFLKGLYRK